MWPLLNYRIGGVLGGRGAQVVGELSFWKGMSFKKKKESQVVAMSTNESVRVEELEVTNDDNDN